MYYLLIFIFSYLLGSIPFSLLIVKYFYKKDIRKEGSGNLGATNTARVAGLKAGIIVLVLDQLKALIAVLITYLVFKNSGYNIIYFIYLSGLAAVIGHCYPVFASFKGGKAVDCSFGFLLITNIYLYIIGFIIFFISIKKSKMVSLSSMISFTSVSLLSFIPFFYKSPFLNINFNIYYSFTILVMALIIIYRHRTNIIRIINKNESKIGTYKN